jgi:hypothetical protein
VEGSAEGSLGSFPPSSKEVEPPTLDTQHAGIQASDELPSDSHADTTEEAHLLPHQPVCHLERRIEVGLMAELLTGSIGNKIFYFILCIYLFGDLSIYAVYVPNSLVAVTGSFDLGSWHLSEDTAYYIFVALFVLITAPFCFFDFQKTKYLQFTTMFCRNAAFAAMVVIAIIGMGKGEGADVDHLKLANFGQFPVLFGSSIYAFMCHHSIPGLLAPVSPKRGINILFALDFFAIFCAYILLAYTGVFSYGDVPIASTYTTFFKGRSKALSAPLSSFSPSPPVY